MYSYNIKSLQICCTWKRPLLEDKLKLFDFIEGGNFGGVKIFLVLEFWGLESFSGVKGFGDKIYIPFFGVKNVVGHFCVNFQTSNCTHPIQISTKSFV